MADDMTDGDLKSEAPFKDVVLACRLSYHVDAASELSGERKVLVGVALAFDLPDPLIPSVERSVS